MFYNFSIMTGRQRGQVIKNVVLMANAIERVAVQNLSRIIRLCLLVKHFTALSSA